MIRFSEILSIQEKGGIDDNNSIGFSNPVELGYRFMETIKVFQYMRAENFIKSIRLKGVREGIYIVDLVTTVVYDVEIYISWFKIFATTYVKFH
jgi:hypothetical protein